MSRPPESTWSRPGVDLESTRSHPGVIPESTRSRAGVNPEQFGSNRRQKMFGRKPCTRPYLIFTSENHLNAHSSLIKQHMAMTFAPLDCPCQGASSESKKIYMDFFILEKIAKNQKIHIFGSHGKKWVQWPELLLYLNSTDPIQ
jgi:hypothetical protein